MARAFVGVGSNINPAENVREAVRRLARAERVKGISTVYQTPALGGVDQPPYYNCVVEIETATPPAPLRQGVLRRIEAELGRSRTADKYAARTIDLDLIWHDGAPTAAGDGALPDPEIADRPFLAVPLCELAPELVLPGSGLPVCDAAARLARRDLEPLTEYTRILREDVSHVLLQEESRRNSR